MRVQRCGREQSAAPVNESILSMVSNAPNGERVARLATAQTADIDRIIRSACAEEGEGGKNIVIIHFL